MTKTISASALQAYLATQPPDTEINLATLATTMQDNNLQEAVTFFSTLAEAQKVKYLMLLLDYYHYVLTNGLSVAGYDPIGYDSDFVHEVEDNFTTKFNLDTTQLVPLRRLLGRLQRETCKQRQYKKEEVAL